MYNEIVSVLHEMSEMIKKAEKFNQYILERQMAFKNDAQLRIDEMTERINLLEKNQ